MTLQGELRTRDGCLFVAYKTTFENAPIERTLWWAVQRVIGDPYSARRPSEGDRVTHTSSGMWSAYRDGSTGIVIASKNEATFVDDVPVAPPKTKLETRWRHGAWEKLTKKGWVRV
jgi:hypothetical protein